MKFKQILLDLFTTSDGQTIAYGRVFGTGLGGAGLTVVIAAVVTMIKNGHTTSVDWSNLLNSLTAYIPALAGAVAGLVWGTLASERPLTPPGPTPVPVAPPAPTPVPVPVPVPQVDKPDQ